MQPGTTLILITTNEPVSRLHPAAPRAGRCLADIGFTAFPELEANAWLAAHGQRTRVSQPTSLAELFSHSSGTTLVSAAVDVSLGFARR